MYFIIYVYYYVFMCNLYSYDKGILLRSNKWKSVSRVYVLLIKSIYKLELNLKEKAHFMAE